MQSNDDGPEWKKLKLSLERPYKNDNGDHIPVLLDITPDGPIYEEYGLGGLASHDLLVLC